MNHGRRESGAIRIREQDRKSRLHDANRGIGRSQIDADYVFHFDLLFPEPSVRLKERVAPEAAPA